jgi:hypothetical protein
MPGAPAKLNAACERAKIRLSRTTTAEILVAHYANTEGSARTLEEPVSRNDLESSSRDLVDRGLSRIDELLSRVDVSAEAIELCLATGGMVQMPAIRARLIERFGGPGRVPSIENGDRMMAEGAAWIASDKQSLTLAKPFEVLHADDVYVPLLDADTELPTIGNTLAVPFSMFCADPRDGFAHFLFARPAAPDRTSASDQRTPYGVAVLAVDPTAPPLRERLELRLSIDDDLVVHLDIQSSLAGDHRSLHLHNLEFGLRLGAE